MKTPPFPLLFLLLLAGSACSDDDAEDGASPDAASDDGVGDAGQADAGEPPPPVDATVPPGPFMVEGDVVGEEVPADAEVIVVWAVSSGSPDHAYKYGDGSATGPEFVVSVADEPPPDLALNDYGSGRRLGVGYLVLVPTGTDVPEGVVGEEGLPGVLGYSRTPIIWREGTFGDGLKSWPGLFEEGSYQCGRCTPAPEGETFDGFEPMDCGEVEIDAPPLENDCNWT